MHRGKYDFQVSVHAPRAVTLRFVLQVISARCRRPSFHGLMWLWLQRLKQTVNTVRFRYSDTVLVLVAFVALFVVVVMRW